MQTSHTQTSRKIAYSFVIQFPTTGTTIDSSKYCCVQVQAKGLKTGGQ